MFNKQKVYALALKLSIEFSYLELKMDKSKVKYILFELCALGNYTNTKEAFTKQYPHAYEQVDELLTVIEFIDDPEFLLNTIVTRLKEFEDENRNIRGLNEHDCRWFSLAFQRLADLTEYVFRAFEGSIQQLHLVSDLSNYMDEESEVQECIQELTLDQQGNLIFSGYRKDLNGGPDIKIRTSKLQVDPIKLERLFQKTSSYFSKNRKIKEAYKSGYYQLDLTNENGETFTYLGATTIHKNLILLSNVFRFNLQISDLFAFDGNMRKDRVEQLSIHYQRIVFQDALHREEDIFEIPFHYEETILLNRHTNTIDIKRNINDDCKVQFHYEADIISDFLDDIVEHNICFHEVVYPDDVYKPADVEKNYTITIDYKHQPQKIIKGIFDRDGLPRDYEFFASELLELLGHFRFSEILDEHYYDHRNPHVDDYIYCSVRFKHGYKEYYYICDDFKVDVGDFVVVPGSNGQETVGQVINVEYFQEEEVPYPIEKTKHIIRILSDEEIEDLDFFD